MKKPVCEGKSFDTADLKTGQRPLWEDVDDAMSYISRFKERDARTKQEYYRVFAYARKPMKLGEWQELFDAFEVKKISGQFEDYAPFTSLLKENPGRSVARHTIKQMVDAIERLKNRIEVLENEELVAMRALHTFKRQVDTIARLKKKIELLEDGSTQKRKKQAA